MTFAYSLTDTDLDDAQVAQTGGSSAAFFGTADIHANDSTATLIWTNAVPDSDLLDLTVTLSHTETQITKHNFTLGAICAPGSSQVLCKGQFGYATTAIKAESRMTFGGGAWQNSVILGAQVSSQDRAASSSLGAMGLRHQFARQRRLAKLQALYAVNGTLGIFGTFAQPERRPTLDALYSCGTSRAGAVQVPSLTLENETARTFEFGMTVKRDNLLTDGDSLQLKATLFHNDLDNLIAANTTGAARSTAFVNVAKVPTWGGEIEAAYDAERWLVNLGYSDVKSRNQTPGAGYDTTLADTLAENLSLGAKLPDAGVTLG